MVQYAAEKRILIIKDYTCKRSYLKTQNTLGIQLLDLRVLSNITIHYCFQKFSVNKT